MRILFLSPITLSFSTLLTPIRPCAPPSQSEFYTHKKKPLNLGATYLKYICLSEYGSFILPNYMMMSGSFYFPENYIILVLLRLDKIIVYAPHFLQPLISIKTSFIECYCEYCGHKHVCSGISGITNLEFEYIPKSSIIGSYGGSVFSVSRVCQLPFPPSVYKNHLFPHLHQHSL